MRWLLALIVLTNIAHADGSHFTVYGIGTSMAKNEPGWAMRVEKRLDATKPHAHEGRPLFGARIGVDLWSAGPHWGFAMPLGMYFGGQVKNVRTTLGGGLGLWAFEWGTGEVKGGVAPFASASVEGFVGKMILSLDGKLARQVLAERNDYNVFSVMLMVGRRFER